MALTIATIALGLAGAGWGSPLNFSGEAWAAAAGGKAEKVQDVPTPTRPPPTKVTLAFVPGGTTVAQLAKDGLSPGLLSAGLGAVPAEQTYLDIAQGNRIFDSLYDRELPPLGRDCSAWEAVVKRAESAPADIVPGLLQSTLAGAGVVVRRGPGTSCTFSADPSRASERASREKLSEGPPPNDAPILVARTATLRTLSPLVGNLRGNDLLIAIAKPPPPDDRALPVGVAGRGFGGNLTSASTRLDGYVLSTDIAPTILERLGIAVPSQMSGQAIRADGSLDAAAVESLGERMAAIPARRGPVIGFALLVWAVALALAAALSRGGLARGGVRLAGLSAIYLPLVLLLGAALEPSQGAEQLMAVFGAPLLALLTLIALPGYGALALASGITALAYAADVIAGSPLTSLSLAGPNPGLGVRFYGIGNELEALLSVLALAGTGAALTAFFPAWPARRSAFAFLGTGLLFAFVFGAGRFCADVGAAIVLPLGAAVAAAAILASRSRGTMLLVICAPFAAVALLALLDLLSGANAHLTRSVLDAGGFGDLADVAQRRLQLSARTFVKPIVFVYLPLLAAVVVWGVARRERVEAWLQDAPALRGGLAGALAAVLLGTLANDSGGIVLEIGTAFLLVFGGFAWAEAGDPRGRYS
jgi:hypothetical protein